MYRFEYEKTFKLIMRLLPVVAQEKVFALKGGTAINLFYRELPRLSVDIDVTYLPIKERVASLTEIDDAMGRMSRAIRASILGAESRRIQGGGGAATRLVARLNGIEVKVETSSTARGVVHEPELRDVSEAVSDEFGHVTMTVVSFEDLFAGKLNAALDRQHPRDLYDVKLLYENEGLSDELFRTFLVYVAGSPRPMHELLNPNLIDLDLPFILEFSQMTRTPVSLDDLAATRKRLIADVQSRFDGNAKRFLLSLHDAEPDFGAIDREGAERLPAIRWKLVNLQRLIRENPDKHAQQRRELETVLG